MYRIEPDLNNSRICYIYEDTENATRCKLTVISDFDLARRITDYLNEPTQSIQSAAQSIQVNK